MNDMVVEASVVIPVVSRPQVSANSGSGFLALRGIGMELHKTPPSLWLLFVRPRRARASRQPPVATPPSGPPKEVLGIASPSPLALLGL
jgi:hypothetical protein